MSEHPVSARRYDLDWLRVAAFGLLIFYHIGMFYVTWDWHVKSPYSSHFLEPLMGLINPWRLGLLFFISGVALRFAMDKAERGFVGRRTLRLFIPVVFGMVLWVAPQAYYELLYKGETAPGLWQFWLQYIDPDQEFSITTPTWNHLWYVVYVLIYTLIIAALLPVLRRLAGPVERLFRRMERSALGWLLVAVPVAMFAFYVLTMGDEFPVTHALIGDWFNHASSFSMLLVGCFAAKSRAFWGAVEKVRRLAVGLALGTGIAIAAFRVTGMRGDLFDITEVVYAWTVILSLLGLAQRYLNRPSRALGYLTEAVFPYYVMHQTLIVCLGAWAIPSGLPLWAEASFITVGTVAGCGLGYELLIRRVPVLRPLFGLSWHDRSGGRRDRALEAPGDGAVVER